ncbi:uncharacterized protein LOC116033045 [Ipomoea triloba]|uniref:uncharacterized protein LOC116033045 n=1 Tax=Ipomoea triloba TaxID=35885 RepID=UPI00125DDB3E|nr:uncharacterized protein LOC116033045 [Ipomoea triloba]
MPPPRGPQQRKRLHDYVAGDIDEEDIYYPRVEANNFEIKPAMISLISNNQFGCSKSEDPTSHMRQFLRVCKTLKINGVSVDAIRLRLFPFSLRDDAQVWLDSHPADHFQTWDQLHHEFMREFYPLSKASRLKKQIQEFKQMSSESFERSNKKLGAGIYEIDQTSALVAKLDSVVHMVQKLAQN